MNKQKVFVSFCHYDEFDRDKENPRTYFGNCVVDIDLNTISNFAEMIIHLEKKIEAEDDLIYQVLVLNVQKTDNFLNFK